MSLVTFYTSVKQTLGRPIKSAAPRHVLPDELVTQIALLLANEDFKLEPTQHTVQAFSVHLFRHTGESALCDGIAFSYKKPDGKITLIGRVCKGNAHDIANHAIVRLDRRPDAKFGFFWSAPQCVARADFARAIKGRKIFDFFDDLPLPSVPTAQTPTVQPGPR